MIEHKIFRHAGVITACALLVLLNACSGFVAPTIAVNTPEVDLITLPEPALQETSEDTPTAIPQAGDTALPSTDLPATPAPTDTPAGTATPTVTPFPTLTPPPEIRLYPMPLMGAEASRLDTLLLTRISEAGINFTRRNALLWSLVEPEEGMRNWGAVASLENDLQDAAENGIEVMLIIRRTPVWAQKVPNIYCGPVKEDKFEAFASFARDVVARYSAPPFNVRFYEFGNEPDVDPAAVSPDMQFGCHGDATDTYYGGEYYGEMLKVIYPAVKAANPQAQVVVGGLLLDCDPTHPPAGKDCTPAKFLEGILYGGAGDSFDAVSFHGYGYYLGNSQFTDVYENWLDRGGAVAGKVNYLRELMAAYQVDKPIYLTESALLCADWAPGCSPAGPTFFEAQAQYVVQLYTRGWSLGLSGMVWYQLEYPGWRSCGLLGPGQGSSPAFEAYRFFTQKMTGGLYRREISGGPEYFGYEFEVGEKRVWIMWSAGESSLKVTLPEGVEAVYDIYGNPITTSGPEMDIHDTVYIEFRP